MLGSKGVMQVGWCTLDCKFSGEEGVGDTPTSYAYDGNRLRKWNVSMSKYGEPWLTGDVISCAIDCDQVRADALLLLFWLLFSLSRTTERHGFLLYSGNDGLNHDGDGENLW